MVDRRNYGMADNAHNEKSISRRKFLATLGVLGVTSTASNKSKASPNVNAGWARGDPAYRGQKGKRWAMLIDLRKCVG
ncbi:MAG TPA: twin-arginine translocation signal domain-containing protein, partial [Gammaproteobacteria bacterium]|nr:twin-arginine translocation signal domain-containing protein [Gammaproteobacteria bacterium]